MNDKLSPGLNAAIITLLSVGICGFACGAAPFSPWWLSISGFSVFLVCMLVLTILIILERKGIIR